MRAVSAALHSDTVGKVFVQFSGSVQKSTVGFAGEGDAHHFALPAERVCTLSDGQNPASKCKIEKCFEDAVAISREYTYG